MTNTSRLLIAATLILVPAAALAAEDVRTAASATPEGAFVVKPYLQIGSAPATGTLSLLWHAADADADWSVEYADRAGSPLDEGRRRRRRGGSPLTGSSRTGSTARR